MSPSRGSIRRTASARDEFILAPVNEKIHTSIVVFGASGDLAKKKTYPALFALYSKSFLPTHIQIIGYARSPLTDQQLRDKLRQYLPKGTPEVEGQVTSFLQLCTYMSGSYDVDEQQQQQQQQQAEGAAGAGAGAGAGSSQEGGEGDGVQHGGYTGLNARLAAFEAEAAAGGGIKPRVGRLFYLALPPSTYPQVCAGLRRFCYDLGPSVSTSSWFRCIMEKPFGFDLDSSEELAAKIGALFSEEHIYRIDHYLGKELVQNMLVMRFANTIMSSWWNRHHVSNVQISFKEPFGTEGRGGYFDQYGIVRDVIQNHLLQVLALLMMEPPVSMHPDDVRDEKVKLLRSVREVDPADCVIGQYVAGNGYPGYLDDPTVPRGSKQATYAAVRLHIHNERWAGVPIMIKAGKALNERLVAVRMQLKTPAASIFGNLENMRNELVIKFQPGEAIYIKLVVKTPGLDMNKEMSELELTYPERYKHLHIPDAYERLILDCIRGDAQHFVRRDELRAAWAIFTPLLHAIERGELQPEPYEYGSRGPASIDEWTAKGKYIKTEYQWQDPKTKL